MEMPIIHGWASLPLHLGVVISFARRSSLVVVFFCFRCSLGGCLSSAVLVAVQPLVTAVSLPFPASSDFAVGSLLATSGLIQEGFWLAATVDAGTAIFPVTIDTTFPVSTSIGITVLLVSFISDATSPSSSSAMLMSSILQQFPTATQLAHLAQHRAVRLWIPQ